MIDTEAVPSLEIIAGGSAVPDPPATVRVPCTCPQKHDRDTVYLTPTLTVPMSIAIASALGEENNVAVVNALLTDVYLNPQPAGGLVSWTKTDDDGPVPLTRENIDRLLPWAEGGLEVAEAASGLYAETYFAPLLRRRASFLQAMQTERSTSPNRNSGTPRRKRSKPSSRRG